MKLSRNIFKLLLIFWIALGAGWSGGILYVSQQYVDRLLHPACVYLMENSPFGFEDWSVSLPSGERLKGWWHPPQNGVAVLLLGGHGSSRDSLMWEARLLAQHGLGVLSMDSRVCAGLPATLGVRESEDAQVALDWIQSQPEVEQVAVLGFSAGGVAGIRLAARNPQVVAVITEGNYPSLKEEVLDTPPAVPFSLRWQLQHGVAFLLGIRLGMPIEAIRPIEDLEKIAPRPILLIFGEKEALDTRALDQYQAAKEPKTLWIVPGADHGQYKEKAPQEYEVLLIQFLNQLSQIQP